MLLHAVRRFGSLGLAAVVLAIAASCGGIVDPDPVVQTETFTGTLQPLGLDFKTFTIAYAQGTSPLSVSVDSLKRVSDSSSVTGITIGVGFGSVSGSTCTLQVQQAAAALATPLSPQNGASAGTYCVQIFDCAAGATPGNGCTPTLPEAVTYSMTIQHY